MRIRTLHQIFIITSIVVVLGLVIGCGLSKKEYTLDVFLNVEEAGAVQIEPEQEKYLKGTEVELTAVPESGWYFSEWEEDLQGSENPAELVMDEDKVVTAVFQRLNYELTIDTVGLGDVDIVDVIEPQSNEYPYETVVKLKAIPHEGWEFTEWTGDIESTDVEIIITLDGDKAVTVMFDIREEGSGFAGGDGTEGNPYLVGTADQLNKVRGHLADNFRQIADIDLIDYSSGEGWEPIGDDQGFNEFAGTFDGNSFIITSLCIDRPTAFYVGLFGYLDDSSEIKNVTLTAIDITGRERVGGIAGYSRGAITNSNAEGVVTGKTEDAGGLAGSNRGKIEGSHFIGEVYGKEIVGGLVGYNRGDITDCYAMAEVVGSEEVGGLVGFNFNGNIVDCFASGNIYGSGYTGGLVGYNLDGIITSSYATGEVNGNNYTGGLAGNQSGSGGITDSYATGDVEGNNHVGGLVGSSNDIANSYATGNVKGNDYVGGLVGRNYESITDTYATGSVTGENSVGGLLGRNEVGEVKNSYSTGIVTGNNFRGGLVGRIWMGSIENSYWDTDASQMETSAGGKGRTSAQLKAGTPGVKLDEDGNEDDDGDIMYEDWNELEDVWEFGSSEEYPRFLWQE